MGGVELVNYFFCHNVKFFFRKKQKKDCVSSLFHAILSPPQESGFTLMQIETTLKTTKNGDRYAITYASKDGQKKLIARIIPYVKSAQGKRALAKNGEIKESPYTDAIGYGDGVKVLKSAPESGLYLAFQKLVRDEITGQFSAHEHRTMKAESMLSIEKI
jgi:hypothetical protein